MEHRRRVEFSPRAAREVERARDWWLENREKAPNAFDEALADLVERLEAGADHVGARARNVQCLRRVLLSRIRYYAYFRIVAGDRVQVAALPTRFERGVQRAGHRPAGGTGHDHLHAAPDPRLSLLELIDVFYGGRRPKS